MDKGTTFGFCHYCNRLTRGNYRYRFSVWGLIVMLAFFFINPILSLVGLLIRQKSKSCLGCKKFYLPWIIWVREGDGI